MKNENEKVVVHGMRGFVGQNLQDAFQESEAISRGTRVKQHLFSLSLNPPKDEDVDVSVFEDAIERAEQALGLNGQPRAIVFHEKIGADGQARRHAHAVWCRIEAENMRGVHLPFTKRKLQDLARDLYRENDWKMPRGFVRYEERNPTNYSLAEWQQAKRAGRDPQKLKSMIQDCWLISDCKISFANALKENGFILAKGDKRGAVAVDHTGEAFSVSRAVNIKAKQVRDRLGDVKELPDTRKAHDQAANLTTNRLDELKTDQRNIAHDRLRRIAEQRERVKDRQDAERRRLKAQLAEKHRREEQERQARIKKGWRGLLDRITGKRKRIIEENKELEQQSQLLDQRVQADLLEAQRQSRARFIEEAKSTKVLHKRNIREPDSDIFDIAEQRKEAHAERERETFKSKRRPTSERRKRKSRSRDGPSLDR